MEHVQNHIPEVLRSFKHILRRIEDIGWGTIEIRELAFRLLIEINKITGQIGLKI
jgi:hypothetical protein